MTRKNLSVWLIDDNDIDNFINQKILESCGVTSILTFTSATKALQHLTTTTDIPQLILLDIVFPIMDGFEFLDKFAKLEIAKQSIHIFILTTSANPADREMARQKKCGFIEKPLTEKEVFALLDKIST